jgi:uncharacterized protein YbcI
VPDIPLDGPGRGELLAQISTELVRLHARFYGKGPTKAKTYFAEDTIVCILRDGFTTVERTLLDSGNLEAVYEMRHSFQQVMESEFKRVINEATGREVIAYMSTIHVEPDMAVETFILAPTLETALEADAEDRIDGKGPLG